MKIYDFENHFYAKELFDLLLTRKKFPYADEKKNIHISDQMITINSDIKGVNSSEKTITDDLLDIGVGRIANMDAAKMGTACLSTSDSIELLPRK